jgi:glycosyltransferase involved in cell wall biosynthesis
VKRRLVVITEIIAPYRIPVLNALAALSEIDLDVLFLSETDPSLREWRVYKQEIQFRYEVLSSFRRRLGKYNLLLNYGVAAALQRAHPDIILCGGYSYLASWLAAYWARQRRIPFLLWVESTAADLRRRRGVVEALKRHYFGLCAGFVVAGRSSREYVRQFETSDRPIFTAPNAIDNDFFHRGAEDARRIDREGNLRQRMGLPDSYFLNVGRLVEAKGVFDLIDAYAKLDSQLRSNVGLVFVGDGPARRELMARAQDISPGRVDFRGFVQKEQMPVHYALARALVFPTHSDTWGFVVNEAMACGLPVIVSDVAGCVADLIGDQRTGLTVRPSDVSGLASAMDALAEDENARIQMSQKALRRILDYSPQACAAGIAEAVLSVRGCDD